MAAMSERECGFSEWMPLATGATSATVELKTWHPALIHVSRSAPNGDIKPAFTITHLNRIAQLVNLNKKDTIYGRTKREGTTADVVIMIDKGRLL